MDVIVRPDGTEVPAPEPEKEDGSYSLKQLNEIVGGYIQILKAHDGRCVVINEEGKMKDLEPNIRATAMVGLFPGDFIVGDALFCEQEHMK
jgi:hypothetical protein